MSPSQATGEDRAGGQVVATGAPEAVARVATSYTGQFLRRILKNSSSGKGSQSAMTADGK